MLGIYFKKKQQKKSGNVLTYSLKSLMFPGEPRTDHLIAGEKPGLSQRNLPSAGIASIFLTGMENINGDHSCCNFSGRKDAKNSQSAVGNVKV